MLSIFRVFAKNMLTVDEPDHSRLRGIVEEAFRRRAVLDMAPRIRAFADQLADELFAQGSPADLVARYARTLPLSVICELLGLPLADRPKFMAWANRATSASSTFVFLRMVPTLVAIKRYLQQCLEHARAVGGQGLIAELVQVEKEGAPISSEEMVVMVFLLLFAGHETTTHLISGSVFELAKNPALRDWLAEDWSRADLAIEIPTICLAGTILETALHTAGRGAGRRPAQARRPDRGHVGGRQPGSGSKRDPRKARS
jgi:cytochrome P450